MTSQPYKCVQFLVKIFGNTLGVVEGLSMELEIDGGVVHVYGSRTGKHSPGGKRTTWSVRRWLMADDDTDLLYDLFNDEISFYMTGEISGVSNSRLTLSDCRGLRYRYVTGAAGDIVAEELEGESTNWSSNIT